MYATEEMQAELCAAASAGNVDLVQRLLLTADFDLDWMDEEKGATALRWAADSNAGETVFLLIAAGARVDIHCRDGCTALHAAVKHGFMMSAHLLSRHTESLEIVDKGGQTALFMAALCGHYYIFEDLRRFGADPGTCLDDGTTLLHAVARGDSPQHLKIAGCIINGKLGCVNSKDQMGLTPLAVATSHNHVNMAKLLLGGLADLDLVLDIHFGTRKRSYWQAMYPSVSSQAARSPTPSAVLTPNRSTAGSNFSNADNSTPTAYTAPPDGVDVKPTDSSASDPPLAVDKAISVIALLAESSITLQAEAEGEPSLQVVGDLVDGKSGAEVPAKDSDASSTSADEQVHEMEQQDVEKMMSKTCHFVHDFALQVGRRFAQLTERSYDERYAALSIFKVEHKELHQSYKDLKRRGKPTPSGSGTALFTGDVHIKEEVESLRMLRFRMRILDDHLRKLLGL